ncbi:NAD-dependent epimerase [Phreatobacter stygius]|uniref:NAD-dependent epimerase n=1 Tax=Phreatobacter stygius TaxID=1940610 RepID=A0A4D7AUU7_9HYPH|nr:NAD-dependent epimerase [Phreatobacter stygius]QCI63471.1 NAD-dependent epimerase [Phreatobacter stygius]
MTSDAGPILVTGTAGFIGFHTAVKLLDRGLEVIGVDNVNDYYDPNLKEARLARLGERQGHQFHRIDIADGAALNAVFTQSRPRRVIHLAAQAGVRYSLVNPHAYVQANLVGFANILECCRHHGVEHLVYASTSSVYGANTNMPFSVRQNADHPLTLYAASKRANELMAHSYSHLFGLPTTGLRFFTVYGPWGRPDMMMYIFTKAILDGREIELFNHGEMLRDFTYVDDIVEGVVRSCDVVATPDPQWRSDVPTPGTSKAPYRLYNIGNNKAEPLMRVVELLEQRLGRKAKTIMKPMQMGDVPATCADVDDLTRQTGFQPATPLEVGVARFVDWYRSYHQVA